MTHSEGPRWRSGLGRIRDVALPLARRPALARTIGAGLLDSGFASLATFVVGLYAARVFDPSTLGTYALAFATFTLAANISSQLVFVPCEIKTVTLNRKERLSELGTTLRAGLPVALLAALGVIGWLLAVEPNTPPDIAFPLTVTAIVCAFISPVQDHLRRMLHLGDASWIAAVVSIVQFLGIGALAGLAVIEDVPAAWIPFGALAGANFMSFACGLILSRRKRRQRGFPPLELHVIEAIRSGRWLLLSVLMAGGANFVAATLVTRLASASTLGYAEAARICAQPVWVFVIGLRAVLGPRSMEAAKSRNRVRARRISWGFAGIVTTVGLAYITVTGFEWRGNPLPALLPNAYALPYLVLLWTLANIVTGYQSSLRAELMGARREAGIAMAEVWASVGRTLVSATARVTGSYAMPCGFLVGAVVRWLSFGRRAKTHYAGPR